MPEPPVWVTDPERRAAYDQERGNNRQVKPNGPADHHFVLVRSKDVTLSTAPNYLVHGLIPREGLILVWVPPKCGKSFWVFDLTMRIALGWEYRGRCVEQGTVVYVACEGERGLAARNKAFWQSHLDRETDDPPFYLLTTRLNLPGQIDQLVTDITAQIPAAQAGAIVLDTLNRSIAGSESDDKDMSAYVAAADVLRERFKCAVIIVHHCGVDATRPRGHTSLTGAVDAQIAIKRDAENKIITLVEWMKDGPEGENFASRLEPVNLGFNDNGLMISSCVVAATEGSSAKAVKKTKLPDAAKIALKQLTNAIIKAGELIPSASGVPDGKLGVKIDLWRQYTYQGGISDGESDSAKRNAFNRGKERLIAEEIVGIWGEWAWIC